MKENLNLIFQITKKKISKTSSTNLVPHILFLVSIYKICIMRLIQQVKIKIGNQSLLHLLEKLQILDRIKQLVNQLSTPANTWRTIWRTQLYNTHLQSHYSWLCPPKTF